jgi:hypothetical protein
MMIRLFLWLATLPAAAIATPGAGEEAAVGDPAPAADELPGAERIQELVLELAREVEAIRGERFTCLPIVRLSSRDEILRRARESGRAYPSAQALLVEETCAKMLGMLPGQVDLYQARMEFLEGQLDGFFDPDASVLYVARDAAPGSPRLQLVNGLAQLLDEQHHGLSQSALELAGNGDARLALQAVALGSAAAVEEAWKIQHADRLTTRERRQTTTILDLAALGDLPPYVWKPLMVTASRGPTFLRRSGVLSILLQSVRPRDLDRALHDLPASTEQVLHPVKYWKSSRADAPRSVGIDVGGLDETWELLREDTLGELRLGILLETAGAAGDGDAARGIEQGPGGELASAFTHVPSEGWGGDRYVLLRRAGGYLLVLATVWDEIADAREFHEALEAARPYVLENLASMPGGGDEARRGVRIALGARADEVSFTVWVDLDATTVQDALERIDLSQPE